MIQPSQSSYPSTSIASQMPRARSRRRRSPRGDPRFAGAGATARQRPADRRYGLSRSRTCTGPAQRRARKQRGRAGTAASRRATRPGSLERRRAGCAGRGLAALGGSASEPAFSIRTSTSGFRAAPRREEVLERRQGQPIRPRLGRRGLDVPGVDGMCVVVDPAQESDDVVDAVGIADGNQNGPLAVDRPPILGGSPLSRG